MLKMKSGKSPKGPVDLTPEQQALRKRLRRDLKEIMGKIYSDARVLAGEIDRLGETAAELHQSLKASGVSVRHHEYMVKNRGREA